MEFRILGPLQVVDDTGRELTPAGTKQRALLAILLLHANEVVSSDRLIDELWGDVPPPTAAKGLQVHISRLRHLLEDTQANGDGLLVTHAGGYVMRVESARLDLKRFEHLVAAGCEALAAGVPSPARAALCEALALWRGPPLADLAYQSFAQPEIARIEALRQTALERRIDADLALGLHAEVISELQALVREHPRREQLRARLMVGLYRAGRQADALDIYRDLRHTLVDELGIEPSDELRALERAVLAHDPILDLQPPITLSAPSPPGDAGDDGGTPAPARSPRSRRPIAAGLGGAALVTLAIVLVVHGSPTRRPHPALSGDSQAVVAIDPATARVTDALQVGARPGPLAYDRATGSLWVGNRDDRSVTHIDAHRSILGRTLPAGGVPTGLAAGHGAVWVASGSPVHSLVTVRKIDPRFDTPVGDLRVASLPGSDVALALGPRTLWVGASVGLLTQVDPGDLSVTRNIDANAAPTAVAADAQAVWIADRSANTVTRIDRTSGLVTPIPVGNAPAGIAIGDNAVWVTLALDDALLRIDRERGAVVARVKVGRAPVGVAVGAHGIWVANSGDGTVSRVDPANDAVVQTTDVGASPQDVVVAAGRVWVSVSPRALGAPKPGGTIRVESRADVVETPLDPGINDADWQLQAPTCAKLLNYPDAPGAAGSRLEPEVAEALPMRSADGRTYTFRIRPGFRFSPPSDQPVTAQVFKYTIERSLDPGMRSAARKYMTDIVGAGAYEVGLARHIAGVSASGNVLRVRLTKAAADLPTRLALPFFCAVPIGTPIEPAGVARVPSAGPYYVTSWAPGQGVVLERNPNYHGPRPRSAQTIRVTVGARDPVADVERGRADYALDGLTRADALRLEARYGPGSAAARRGRQRYFVHPLLSVAHIDLNTSRPPFSSERLRRAVNYAIDRRALAAAGGIANGLPATPLSGYLPPGVPGARSRRVYPFRPDLSRARRLAGSRRRNAVLWTFDQPPAPTLAAIVKQNLKRIGIDVHVRLFPRGGLLERLGTRGAPFDMAVQSWIADYPDPNDFLMLFDGSRIARTQNLNHAYYDDPVFNRQLASLAAVTGARRYIAYGKLADQLARHAAPWAAFATDASHEFLSARIGCAVEQPIYGLDLAALCIRR